MEAEMAASWAFRSRGLVGALVMTVFGVVVVTSAPVVPEGSWSNLQFDAIGWLMFVAGAALRFWATLYIGGRKTQTVVCEGPYSICRNPLYLGTFLIATSAAVMLQSLTFAAGILLAAIFYALATVPAEERFLREKLGPVYVSYCQRVPRFWPCFAGYRTAPTITVSIKGLRLECRRAGRWIWLPIFMEILSRLRAETWWPHLLSLP